MLVSHYRWQPEYVWKRLNGSQGWAYYGWAKHNQAAQVCSVKLVRDYVSAEKEKILSNVGQSKTIKRIAK